MGAIQNPLMGFPVVLTPMNLWFAFLGSLLETIIRLLPGIGPAAGTAMLVPLTFKADEDPFVWICSPCGIQKSVVDTLANVMERVIDSDGHKMRIASMSLALRYMDSAQFAQFWEEYEAKTIEMIEMTKQQQARLSIGCLIGMLRSVAVKKPRIGVNLCTDGKGYYSDILSKNRKQTHELRLRRIPFVDRELRDGKWLKQEMWSVCRQLKGKTVGLLGLGNIGREVAQKLGGFEVKIIYYDVRRVDEAAEQALSVRYVPFDQLLAETDILSVHVPLLESTRNVIDEAAIAKMKDGAVIINTSRGGVVDEAALYCVLRDGKIFGAGLDTYVVEPPLADNPLFALDQVVVTPHTGAVVVDNVVNVTIRVFENMQRLLRGEPLPVGDQVA